jgi:hypothetical protein
MPSLTLPLSSALGAQFIMLKYSDNVKFQPWQGEKYGDNSRFGIGILILGESHYGNTGEERANITKEYINNEWSHAFWTEIGSMVMNANKEEFERHEFWEHVAFYNYVQSFAGTGPRQSPTSKQFQDSEQAFVEVLENLKPKLILVMGKRLWGNAANFGRKGEPIVSEKKISNTWLYPFRGGEAFTVCINHPASFGFVASHWTPIVQKSIQIAKIDAQVCT